MGGRIVVAVEKYGWIRVVISGYISDKVDEKVDKSGWRIKIVADCGYTHPIVGQKWVPRGALLSRGRVWPVDVPETLCKFMPTL